MKKDTSVRPGFGTCNVEARTAEPATRTRKDRLRKRVLATRMSLDRGPVKTAGQAILARVLSLEAYSRAKLVHTYVSSKENEVDTRALIGACLAHGKRVAVPVVMPGTKTLAHALIDGLDQLVVGPYGLAQPDPAVATWLPAEAQIDLVVVPGLAFDRRGQRIGWGGGYYDRFLAQVQAVKIGLCYNALVLNYIPDEPHDVPVDIVVAETAIYQEAVFKIPNGPSSGPSRARTSPRAPTRGGNPPGAAGHK